MRGEAFERLYEQHAEQLLSFLDYRTGDPVLAEDLTAETFERVLRARRPFDRRKASEKTWLYTIALNCVRDHGRRKSAERRALERVGHEPQVNPAPSPDDVEDRAVLTKALEGLSDEEREAVALRYGADLTIPELAKVTGQPLTTADGRVKRALRKLRDELGE